ncbi:MAG: hypothetical protein ACKOPC_09500 [Methylocystis sp.]
MSVISHAALSQAVILCDKNHQNFASVGPRCLSYLTTIERLAGSFYVDKDADNIFLSLVRAELEGDPDEAFVRDRTTWASA